MYLRWVWTFILCSPPQKNYRSHFHTGSHQVTEEKKLYVHSSSCIIHWTKTTTVKTDSTVEYGVVPWLSCSKLMESQIKSPSWADPYLAAEWCVSTFSLENWLLCFYFQKFQKRKHSSGANPVPNSPPRLAFLPLLADCGVVGGFLKSPIHHNSNEIQILWNYYAQW